jgi:hypothetical protein
MWLRETNLMLVHHTVGLRQQLGRAKFHSDPNCRYLRKGIGFFSEDIPEASIAPRQWCRRCLDAAQPGSLVNPITLAE